MRDVVEYIAPGRIETLACGDGWSSAERVQLPNASTAAVRAPPGMDDDVADGPSIEGDVDLVLDSFTEAAVFASHPHGASVSEAA